MSWPWISSVAVVPPAVPVALAAYTPAFALVEPAIADYNDSYEHAAHWAYAVARPREMMFPEFVHSAGSATRQSPSVPDRF